MIKFSNFFFQAKKKEAKKAPGHLRLCPGLKAPGRNYKLLPALATNSPPDCLLNASRPQRFKVLIDAVFKASPFGRGGGDSRRRVYLYMLAGKHNLFMPRSTRRNKLRSPAHLAGTFILGCPNNHQSE